MKKRHSDIKEYWKNIKPWFETHRTIIADCLYVGSGFVILLFPLSNAGIFKQEFILDYTYPITITSVVFLTLGFIIDVWGKLHKAKSAIDFGLIFLFCISYAPESQGLLSEFPWLILFVIIGIIIFAYKVVKIAMRYPAYSIFVAIIIVTGFLILFTFYTDVPLHGVIDLDTSPQDKPPADTSSKDMLPPSSKGVVLSEFARNWGLLGGALIAAFIAIWRSSVAEKQLALQEQGINIDRMAKAVEMLASDKLLERLGAINSLQQMMRRSASALKSGDKTTNHEADWQACNQILREFIRYASTTIAEYREQRERVDNWLAEFEVTNGNPKSNMPIPIDCPDICAAVTALQEENQEYLRYKYPDKDKADYRKLSEYDLENAVLSGLDLNGMNLRHFDFFHTDFSLSHLNHGNLNHTNLVAAIFNHADCGNAVFHSAKCTGAKFNQAYCNAAKFHGATCDADFENADLNWTEFHQVDISRANFTKATINGCNWHEAWFKVEKKGQPPRTINYPQGLPTNILGQFKDKKGNAFNKKSPVAGIYTYKL